ncbi:unnamed protein product [Prorocentrum cordatum]|uniref:EF-hand domain-containing protein n=1 Tax=Prorocentrum cordatum TaxID=2364126 RepID=A0ABN9UX56_9DINO|nr:unnamed protein product [Polarella glacialis]
MGCAGSKEGLPTEPAPSPDRCPPGIAPPAGGLRNYAAGATLTPEELCKFGCGMMVSASAGGRKFDTCCRACATSEKHDQHDEKCRGPPKAPLVCPEGAKCRDRSRQHLADFVHPLDLDYAKCCQAAGKEVEPLTLRMVFDWMDADGSGKLSRKELTEGITIVGDLRGDEMEDRPVISDKAWREVDADGNGVVNFFEFACWAGPRWGLPLGLKRSASMAQKHCCTVLGCPCTEFKPGKLHRCTNCKHKKSLHVQHGGEGGEVDYPAYWSTKSADVCDLVPLPSRQLQDFQALFDSSYKKTWTRDRTRHNPDRPEVPKGYRVINAFRNENGKLWSEYFSRLSTLQDQVRGASGTGSQSIAVYNKEVRTSVASVKFNHGDVLAHDCNEWYLLHGTNPSAAKDICNSDFTIRTAGSNTGTLYGRGLYSLGLHPPRPLTFAVGEWEDMGWRGRGRRLRLPPLYASSPPQMRSPECAKWDPHLSLVEPLDLIIRFLPTRSPKPTSIQSPIVMGSTQSSSAASWGAASSTPTRSIPIQRTWSSSASRAPTTQSLGTARSAEERLRSSSSSTRRMSSPSSLSSTSAAVGWPSRRARGDRVATPGT